MNFKFSSHRFKKDEILPFIENSLCIKLPLANIYYSDQPSKRKFAFISPKRIGNAIIRNKCRRWLREIIKKNINKIKPEYSFIIIGTHKLTKSNFKSCHDMVLLNLKKKQLTYENNQHLSN